jgi:hypothetical protein
MTRTCAATEEGRDGQVATCTPASTRRRTGAADDWMDGRTRTTQAGRNVPSSLTDIATISCVDGRRTRRTSLIAPRRGPEFVCRPAGRPCSSVVRRVSLSLDVTSVRTVSYRSNKKGREGGRKGRPREGCVGSVVESRCCRPTHGRTFDGDPHAENRKAASRQVYTIQ